MTLDKLDIRPGVSMLGVLRHLNYRPWYALAEFVDNSVDSYLKHRSELQSLHGNDFKVEVAIRFDTRQPARIVIRDNAAGIFEAEYQRAFRPAAIPPDRSGLSEFGMGMKSAACWFAPQWSVRTSALGETTSRTVYFDIADIVNDDIDEIVILEAPEIASAHYTEVVLEDPYHMPVGRTVGKIKEHLSDIYRHFVREGLLELTFDGEPLEYSEPAVLNTPYFREAEGPSREWRKAIEFDLGSGQSVRGFAALREIANTSKAGLALFRRGRVIQGSGDEGYRPALIFGQSNSYRYQRLFGELHLDGFDVSHTKDGFQWDENEQPFLELLREHLDSEEMPLLKQAEGYRARVSRAQLAVTAQQAVTSAAQAMERRLPEVLPGLVDAPLEEAPVASPATTVSLASRRFEIAFRDQRWAITVELTDDPAVGDWVDLPVDSGRDSGTRELTIAVSLSHPFMVRYAQADREDVEALLRVAASIALAEVLARDTGQRYASRMRHNINEILRDAMSQA